MTNKTSKRFLPLPYRPIRYHAPSPFTITRLQTARTKKELLTQKHTRTPHPGARFTHGHPRRTANATWRNCDSSPITSPGVYPIRWGKTTGSYGKSYRTTGKKTRLRVPDRSLSIAPGTAVSAGRQGHPRNGAAAFYQFSASYQIHTVTATRRVLRPIKPYRKNSPQLRRDAALGGRDDLEGIVPEGGRRYPLAADLRIDRQIRSARRSPPVE